MTWEDRKTAVSDRPLHVQRYPAHTVSPASVGAAPRTPSGVSSPFPRSSMPQGTRRRLGLPQGHPALAQVWSCECQPVFPRATCPGRSTVYVSFTVSASHWLQRVSQVLAASRSFHLFDSSENLDRLRHYVHLEDDQRARRRLGGDTFWPEITQLTGGRLRM